MCMMELITTHQADTHSDSSDWVRHRNLGPAQFRFRAIVQRRLNHRATLLGLDFVNDVRSRHMPGRTGVFRLNLPDILYQSAEWLTL
jgi:hypothetical protein